MFYFSGIFSGLHRTRHLINVPMVSLLVNSDHIKLNGVNHQFIQVCLVFLGGGRKIHRLGVMNKQTKNQTKNTLLFNENLD